MCGGWPTQVVKGVKPLVTQGWVTGGAGVTGLRPNVDSGPQTLPSYSTHQGHHVGMTPTARGGVLGPLGLPTNVALGSLGGLHDRWAHISAVGGRKDMYEGSTL